MEGDYLERVRKEARLGRHFTPAQFERAARGFREMYQTDPQTVLCSPDVLERFCEIYALAGDAHKRELRYEGIRVSAAVLEPGTVAFEGEVDDQRMGDW